MFINHYDLRKLVTSLSIAFKDNEIKNFIEKLITFKAINSVIDHIYIEKIKNEYKIIDHILPLIFSPFSTVRKFRTVEIFLISIANNFLVCYDNTRKKSK